MSYFSYVFQVFRFSIEENVYNFFINFINIKNSSIKIFSYYYSEHFNDNKWLKNLNINVRLPLTVVSCITTRTLCTNVGTANVTRIF